jgi:hypothetical protein
VTIISQVFYSLSVDKTHPASPSDFIVPLCIALLYSRNGTQRTHNLSDICPEFISPSAYRNPPIMKEIFSYSAIAK